jgi:multimeric flavodoxin WrbA
MAKKVIIISSSPRKGGNSDLLCDEFLNGVNKTGYNVEKIFLKDKNINYCTGCGTCISKGKACSQKDDMAEILNKLINSDVIVMATPIYFYTMCGQMKTFIDRTCSRYNEISNKDFYFIMTAADNNRKAIDRAVEEFRGFTSCLSNPKEKGIIAGTGAWNIGDIKRSKTMKQAFEYGEQC